MTLLGEFPISQEVAGNILPPSFYRRSTTIVAQDLIGQHLVVTSGQTELVCEIVETEAYVGQDDPASHSAPGKTKRNAPMFEEGGVCYVYLIYGMYLCLNIVTSDADHGEAVLIRAAKPIAGLEEMARRRHIDPKNTPKWEKNLLSGPGKLAQALGISMQDNFVSLQGPRIFIREHKLAASQIVACPRIGISKGQEFHYRYCLGSSNWLSKPAPTYA